jgi:hypothetical protein
MGPCIVSIFQYISNKMQLYTVYLYLKTALHVSGGTTSHHQKRIQLYLQHLVFVTPLLLSAAIVEELKPVSALDDGWWYHPKHVEQFPDINKLCNVASCWIYNRIPLRADHILHISRIRVNTFSFLFIYFQTTLLISGFNTSSAFCFIVFYFHSKIKNNLHFRQQSDDNSMGLKNSIAGSGLPTLR